MKKMTYTLLCSCLLIGILSCSSNKSVSLTDSNKSLIKGSWILLEENGIPVDRKQLKHYTEKNFIWHTMDKSNIIRVSAAGEYTIDGNKLLEFVEMTTLSSAHFKGNTAQIEIKIDNDTLFQSTVLPSSMQELDFTEKWLRLK